VPFVLEHVGSVTPSAYSMTKYASRCLEVAVHLDQARVRELAGPPRFLDDSLEAHLNASRVSGGAHGHGLVRRARRQVVGQVFLDRDALVEVASGEW